MYEFLSDVKRDLFFKDEDDVYRLYENSWESFQDYCIEYHLKKHREMLEKFAPAMRFMRELENTYLWKK